MEYYFNMKYKVEYTGLLAGAPIRGVGFPHYDPAEIFNNMEGILIWADTHFWHENVIKYQGRPKNHTEIMFKNWREKVSHKDILLNLGDVVHGISDQEMEIRFPKRLPGKPYLVFGNHDKKGRLEILRNRKWKFLDPFEIVYRENLIIFTHEPLDENEVTEGIINVHGHVHDNPSPGDGSRYINVSVEKTNYQPVYLKKILDNKIEELNKVGLEELGK